MNEIPKQLKFTKTHEWIREDKDEMTIGITEHAQELLGDMVFVDLPELGKEYQAGDALGVVESVKAASDFYTPISGTVIEVNDEARENPALVNQDPYGAGWLAKIRANNRIEMESLLTVDQYQEEIKEEY